MAFATTRDPTACRAFYEGALGLRVLTDDPMALVLDSGGTIIRIQKIPSHEPEQFTVLGWTTPDIRATVARLNTAGVAIERYEWMSMQDQSGVATFPGGDMVAWFKDPDGNILSAAQLK
jgi:catechol 2,3-dioxygenase-like lactoylglutathione lyase family enzyme